MLQPTTLFSNRNIHCIHNLKSLKLRTRHKSIPEEINSEYIDSSTIYCFLSAYLAAGNYNIIGVDWEVLAANPYATAVQNTPLTGAHIAELIEYLVAQTGAKLEDFHLIGHSLGGQVAGFAGKSITTGKVGRITGLNGSVEETSVGLGPLYSVFPTHSTLNKRRD